MKRQAPVDLRVFRLLGRDFFLGGLPEACAWLLAGPRGPVHLVNVHTLVSSFWDAGLRKAQDRATLLPDGRPLSLAANWLGVLLAKQVRGPSLMRELCERGQNAGARHYFYGGAAGAAAALAKSLKAKARGLKVTGVESPAFGPVTDAGLKALALKLKRTRSDFCWVGLGAPKQELFMARLQEQGVRCTLLGVGAAFDYESGLKREAPRWMQVLALEWLYRLSQEPSRLWMRYLRTLPLFLLAFLVDLFGGFSIGQAPWMEGSVRMFALLYLTGVLGYFSGRVWVAFNLLMIATLLRSRSQTRKVVHAP